MTKFFALSVLSGYMLTLMILSLLPTVDGNFISNFFDYFKMSFAALIIVSAIAYFAFAQELPKAKSSIAAIWGGLGTAFFIAILTPVLSHMQWTFLASAGPLPPVDYLVAESTLFAIGGLAYGAIPIVIFGTWYGLKTFKLTH